MGCQRHHKVLINNFFGFFWTIFFFFLSFLQFYVFLFFFYFISIFMPFSFIYLIFLLHKIYIKETLASIIQCLLTFLIKNCVIFCGVITKAQLMNIRNLEEFMLTTDKNQSLVFDVTYDWHPQFSLKSLHLKSCRIGPKFPVWLQVQSELTYVTLKISPYEISRKKLPNRLFLGKNQARGTCSKLFSKLDCF